MFFGESQEDDLDLDELFKNISIPEKNMYIADENKAIELITSLITNKNNSSINIQKKIEGRINHLFSLLSEITFDNKMIFYERFMEICSRLSEIQKIKKIQDKVVISFGGRVSSGKSRFINVISGIGNKLPVDQKTTTAIPTYIIKSSVDSIRAHTVDGYSTEISSEALNAMAHEFDNVYRIGFSAFVDSIIIESSEFVLPKEVALLDTPGYTKYDKESDSKVVLSDRQKAYEQLSISDYLIWLIDIDSGAITDDDIHFMESLPIKTPILIVFTKADLKSDEEIRQIINLANQTIKQTTINCFGITAYSAKLEKEYEKNKIKEFLNFTISSNVRNSDIMGEFRNTERKMREEIKKASEQSKHTAKALFSYIANSNEIMKIRSLAFLWGKSNQEGYRLDKILKRYDTMMSDIKREMQKVFF